MSRNAPPVNQLAEQQLLGALITSRDALDSVLDIIEPSHFYTPAHATVYAATCRAAMEGTLSPAAVVEALRDSSELGMIGGEKLIESLAEKKCEQADVRKTAAIVYELHRKRETIVAARDVAQTVLEGGDDSNAFERLLAARNATSTTGGWTELGSIVTAVLEGTHHRTEPTMLAREDGAFLLYEGKLNWLAGPPESQKSYLAVLALVQEMEKSRPVVYVDFEESDGITMGERLVAVSTARGITADQLLAWTQGPDRLFYYTNAQTLTSKVRSKVLHVVQKFKAGLVVLDGCAAAMGAANLEEDKAKDVSLWLSGSVWPFVSAGAGVLVIDHVVKSASAAGTSGFAARSPRGSGAKLAAVSGVTLMAEPKEAGSAFTEGRVEVSITKDRPGRVRVIKRGTRRLAGMLISTPLNVDGIEATHLRVVDPEDDTDGETAAEERRAKWRRVAAQQISKALKEEGKPLSKTQVREALAERAATNGRKGLRGETIVEGFDLLLANGWAEMSKEGREQKLTLLREYVETYGDKHADEVPVDPF